MSSFDPYLALGVERNAPFREIKAAFYKLAKDHHPDYGGDDDQFHKINLAWNILKDVETRHDYDRTGDTGSEPDNTLVHGVAVIVGTITAIINVLENNHRNPCAEDIIGATRDTITRKLIDLRRQQEPPTGTLLTLENVIRRIKAKDDGANPLLYRALNDQADQLRDLLKVSNNEISAHMQALDILTHFTFDREIVKQLTTRKTDANFLRGSKWES